MRRWNPMAWTLLLALAACGGDQAARDVTTETTQTLLAQPRVGDLATEFDASRLGPATPTLDIDRLGVNAGSVDAPVKVIEFVDYGCGYCRRFQLETWATLRDEYVETGMVEWKFMPFVTGMFGNSEAVTYAAECALNESPRLFGAFSDLLWVRQSDWKGSDDPAALARQWILQLGGNGDAYDACLEDGTRRQRVLSATALAAELGVRSTPTFWIVGAGPVMGALPVDTFRQILTEVHEQASQAQAEAEAAGQDAV